MRAFKGLVVGLVCLLVFVVGGGVASASVTHRFVSSFTGADAPEGPLGPVVVGDAVDQATGDVWVLESNFEGLGIGVVDRFDENGVFAGVQIVGSETPAGSFGFGLRSGVAVDNTVGVNAGDVYVADSEHGVVDRFSASGAYLCQITGVEEPSATECAGVGGSETADGSMSPAGLAVDSSGDLFVADDAHGVVDEFGPSGAYLGQIVDSHLSTEMGEIALNGSGELFVDLNPGEGAKEVLRFDAAGKFVGVLGSGSSVGVAVDPADGNVFVSEFAGGSSITEFEPSGTLLDSFTVEEAGLPQLGIWVAVGKGGKVYSATIASGTVDIYSGDVVLPTVSVSAASGIGKTSATLNGHVDPDTVHGGGEITSCMFEYVTEGQVQEHPGSPFEGASTAACVPGVPYAAEQDVTAEVALAASTIYHFRLVAGNVNGVSVSGQGPVFSTVGPPVVESESSSTLAVAAATLKARINPQGFETTCSLEYVSQSGFEASGYTGAQSIPCTPANLGAGVVGQAASVSVSGLQIDTIYHYRFVASNSAGSTPGVDKTFETFGVKNFVFEVLDKEGQPYTQAGGHPYEWVTGFELNKSGGVADTNIKDVKTELPPGLIGNPRATAKCTPSDLTFGQCSAASQIGTLHVEDAEKNNYHVGVYNVVPPKGVPVEFGAIAANLVRVYIRGNVRTGGDYGVTATALDSSAQDNITGVQLKLWGVPGDPLHDEERFCPVPGQLNGTLGCSAGGPLQPLLVNPTSCEGPVSARMSVDSWQAPGVFASASTSIPEFTGCELLDFTPSISIAPDTSVADAPSGLHVDLRVPQNENPVGLAEADLKNVAVTLPVGVSISPSAASGLESCSPAEIGMNNASEPSCPDASKIGTVEIVSPLLEDHLTGGVYVAEQDNNPFGSLLAIYLTAQADGSIVKLAGHVEADPITGQLTTRFDSNPQLPFSEVKLDLHGGPRGALATPENCGTSQSVASLTPWNGAPTVTINNPFVVSSGCVSGFSPAFTAGSVTPRAGAYTPFVLSFSRSDTDQELSKLNVTLPPGLLAKLAGVPLCTDSQANSGACPEASLIGSVQAGAGPGADPFFLPGKMYLTGPYEGAPYGEAVVVPAVAGPYNLGNVIVRGAININPTTGQATVTTDAFPTILQGIPIRLRQVNATLDRPGFVFNPTSCTPTTLTGQLTSTNGTPGTFTTPFQVGGCKELAFKPRFSASTNGPGTKNGGASLNVKVTASQGPQSTTPEANIRKVEVQLPKALPSRLSTLQKACTEQQFAANPAGCPPASLVGHATARTPALPDPLQGPAYIVSHGGAAFPDLVLVLQADNITIQLTGHTQITKGITYSRFQTIPDAPITSFELNLPTARNSILAANGNLCTTTLNMPTTITAQNNTTIKQTTKITKTHCPTHHKHTKTNTHKKPKHNN